MPKKSTNRRPSTVAYETICDAIDNQLKDLDAATAEANEILDDSFDMSTISLSPTMLTPSKDDEIPSVESVIPIEWKHIDTPDVGQNNTETPCDFREERKMEQKEASVGENTSTETRPECALTQNKRSTRRVSSHIKQSSGLSCKICVIS